MAKMYGSRYHALNEPSVSCCLKCGEPISPAWRFCKACARDIARSKGLVYEDAGDDGELSSNTRQ